MGKNIEDLPSSGRYSNENGGTLDWQVKIPHQPSTNRLISQPTLAT